jgi:transposase, IS5 family
MRKTYEIQPTFGSVDISQIKTDPKSRDEIDRAVLALQYIFVNYEIKREVFKILEENILPRTSKRTGRPGLDLWKILVLGLIRQASNLDFDKLHHMANNDLMIRELLGHSRDDWKDNYYYQLQTIKDNVILLTPELTDKISEVVVKGGHNFLGGKKKEELHTNVDSFVVKTDVHFPSDISILCDSMRKSISLIAKISKENNIKGWRQSKHNVSQIKHELRKIQKMKHCGGSNREGKLEDAHRKYITRAEEILERIKQTIKVMEKELTIDIKLFSQIMEIEKYISYAEYHIDLIRRRVLDGEVIPHNEKMFSIFEPHTRWISKGKMGTPVELGLPITIIKDQYGFILDYEIMEKTSDVEVAIPLLVRAKGKYSAIKSCSFDKGYWARYNKEELDKLIEKLIMSKKGRLNKAEISEVKTKEYIKLRKRHSSVESAINGLEHCGLEKCYDHGIDGFKRCVGLSILARNILTLGKLIQEKEAKRSKRKEYKKVA